MCIRDRSVDAPLKVGIVAGVGDRRDEDIISLGEESAKIFDEIIIRQDKNLRGRTEEEMICLLYTSPCRVCEGGLSYYIPVC